MPNNRSRPRQSFSARKGFFFSDLPPDLSSLSRGEIIAKYHEIRKNLAAIDNNPQFPNEATKEAMRQILRAQLKMIGIETYQNASRAGESLSGGFDSSQWVLEELPRYSERFHRDGHTTISLLDVGAIAHRFPEQLQLPQRNNANIENENAATIALDVTSIDLNPEHSDAGSKVIKADFFDFAEQKLTENMGKYHVICLSLCVNFEGCPKRRGLMLSLSSRLLHPGGVLFLVLPRACVKNSRYLDEDRFRVIMQAAGVPVLSTAYTSKLMKSVAEKRETDPMVDFARLPLASKKEVLRTGKERNNFAITLDPKSFITGVFKPKPSELEARPCQDDHKPGNEPNLKRKMKKKKRSKPHVVGMKRELTSNQRKRARRKALRKQKNVTT